MKFSSVVPAIAALLSFAAAVPVDKRDMVMLTKTQMVLTTVEVVKTVWADPSNSPATKAPVVQPQAVSTPVPNAAPQVAASPKPAAAPSPRPAPVSPPAQPAPKHPKPAVPKNPKPATPAPAPAPAPAPPSNPKPPSSAPSSSGGLFAGQSSTGDITYYAVGLGACGITSTPSENVVAISESVFDSVGTANPNDNPLCGRTVNIQYNGQTFPAKVVDRCTGCAPGDLDLSYGFFGDVTNGAWSRGRISGVHWTWA